MVATHFVDNFMAPIDDEEEMDQRDDDDDNECRDH